MAWLGKVGTRSQAFFGVLTLICGFFMMWGSAKDAVNQRQAQDNLHERAVEVDPRAPRGMNNGTLVLAVGPLISSEAIGDEFLKPAAHLVLRRRAEMFQWTEEKLPGTGTIEYRTRWVEGQVDSFKFQEMRGHENPLLRIEPSTQRVASATFGAFDAVVLVNSIKTLLPLELAPEMLKDPSLRIEDGKIYLPRNPADTLLNQLGDTRVWYEVLPQGDYSVLTVQRDERNLVGAEVVEELIVRHGALSKEQFFQREGQEAGRLSAGLLQLGGLLFFAGLCSVLSPFASRMSLRPHMPVDGMSAVVVLSAGLAALAVVIFWVTGYFS